MSPPLVRAVGVFDLLPREPDDSAPQLIPVRRRTATPNGVRLAASLWPVVVTTRCGPEHCVDGLRDDTNGRVLLAAALTSDDRETLADGGWLERAVRVVSVTERFVSVHLGEAWFSNGAAHSNAWVGCATYDRASGERLTLGDVIAPQLVAGLLERVNALHDAELALERLGSGPFEGCPGCQVHPRGFRLDSGSRGPSCAPEVVLCAEVPVPGADMGRLLEIRLDRLPLSYLLPASVSGPGGR